MNPGGSNRRGGSRMARGSRKAESQGSGNGRRATQPPLTHFLCLPLGHHPRLREYMSDFTNALLSSSPPIAGLDQTIIIPTRRLHFTLGVMSLFNSQDTDIIQTSSPSASGDISNHRPRTIESALTLLRNLKPRIIEMIGDRPLIASLERMDIMRPDRENPETAHVMWAGPDPEGSEGRRLKAVCLMLHQEFKQAGLIIDDKRPLKLHCTVVNTIYRKPRTRNGRTPFSFVDVVASNPFRHISATAVAAGSTQKAETAVIAVPSYSSVSVKSETTTQGEQITGQAEESHSIGNQWPSGQERNKRFRGPFHVDLGAWAVDEVQICEMGSHGPKDEYVSIGGISFV